MTLRPVRVQLRRQKGWRMPRNTVKVDRTTKWGNPYRSDDPATAVRFFRRYAGSAGYSNSVKELAGKNLACWCPLDQPCHADVLLKLANP